MINHDKLISYLKKWLEKQENVNKTIDYTDKYKLTKTNGRFTIGFSFVLMHLFAFLGILLGFSIYTQTGYYSYILFSIVSLIAVVWYDREFIKYRKSPRNKIDKSSMASLFFAPFLLSVYVFCSPINIWLMTLLFLAIIGLGILLFIARIYSPYIRKANLVDFIIMVFLIGSVLLAICLAQQGNDMLAVISLSVFGVSLCLFFIVEIIATCLYRKYRDEVYGIEKPKDLFNS